MFFLGQISEIFIFAETANGCFLRVAGSESAVKIKLKYFWSWGADFDPKLGPNWRRIAIEFVVEFYIRTNYFRRDCKNVKNTNNSLVQLFFGSNFGNF